MSVVYAVKCAHEPAARLAIDSLDISGESEILRRMTPTPSAVAHFDVMCPEPELLHTFYADVFGWEVDPRGPGYALVHTPGDAPDGAIVEAEHAELTIGIVVRDLDAAVAAAVERGGTVVMPPTDNGWVVKAQVADPAGNRLSLIAA
jgi:predicted enzyme related to lactoylglutathione lyase